MMNAQPSPKAPYVLLEEHDPFEEIVKVIGISYNRSELEQRIQVEHDRANAYEQRWGVEGCWPEYQIVTGVSGNKIEYGDLYHFRDGTNFANVVEDIHARRFWERFDEQSAGSDVTCEVVKEFEVGDQFNCFVWQVTHCETVDRREKSFFTQYELSFGEDKEQSVDAKETFHSAAVVRGAQLAHRWHELRNNNASPRAARAPARN